MLKKLLTLSFLCVCTYGLAKQPVYSAANSITFKQGGEIKNFVGNGFLIMHKGKTYGLTAKHVLLETQGSGIKTIAIKDHFESWKLAPFNVDSGMVTLGKLINADKTEKLDIQILKNDWLLLEVIANNSPLVPLKLASKSPQEGQLLSAYGCSYSNKSDCMQNKYSGHYVKSSDHNLLIELEMAAEDMSTLRGLSGAPVLNSDNEVVGIVSNVMPDKDSEKVFFAPFSIAPVIAYLENKG